MVGEKKGYGASVYDISIIDCLFQFRVLYTFLPVDLCVFVFKFSSIVS